jgi:hypothetical protein
LSNKETYTFVILPTQLEITTGGEPIALYEPGAIQKLLEPGKWRVLMMDFDKRIFYIGRERAEPLDFGGRADG